MRKLVVLMVFISVALNSWSQEATQFRNNALGVHVNFIEDDEIGYGLTYTVEISHKDRLFLQVETFEFEDSQSTRTAAYIYEDQTDLEGEEIEFGYLRRLSELNTPLGVFVGPSVGIQFVDGNFKASEATSSEIILYRGSIDYDPVINLYINAMAEYTFSTQIRLFSIFSLGYQFETDGELKYTTGDRPIVPFETDSDTFWNLAVGTGFSF